MNSNESSSSSMELEQQFHDLEKRYVSLKNEYDLCRAENTAHAVKIKALQSIADQSALQASVSDRRVIELEIALSASTLEVQNGTKQIGILKVGTPITAPHSS